MQGRASPELLVEIPAATFGLSSCYNIVIYLSKKTQPFLHVIRGRSSSPYYNIIFRGETRSSYVRVRLPFCGFVHCFGHNMYTHKLFALVAPPPQKKKYTIFGRPEGLLRNTYTYSVYNKQVSMTS
jgi:hypothetical protein